MEASSSCNMVCCLLFSGYEQAARLNGSGYRMTIAAPPIEPPSNSFARNPSRASLYAPLVEELHPATDSLAEEDRFEPSNPRVESICLDTVLPPGAVGKACSEKHCT
jgi:hypothetical protein